MKEAVETATTQTKSAYADSRIMGASNPDLVLQPFRSQMGYIKKMGRAEARPKQD